MNPKLFRKITTLIGIMCMVTMTSTYVLGAGEENANGLFQYQDPVTARMYCPISMDVISNSNTTTIDGTTDWTIESFNPIFFHDPTTTDGFDLNFLGAGIYHPSNAYYSDWPQADTGIWKATMLAGYFSNSLNPGLHNVGTVSFWSKYGNDPATTGITVGFYLDKANDSNDSNIPVSINSRDILFQADSKTINLAAQPCINDTNTPTIDISNIGNDAYRVTNNNISFSVTDEGSTYTYPWGANGTFAFKSSDWNNVNLSNYDLDPSMDNQYGVNSGSILISVEGYDTGAIPYIDLYDRLDVSAIGEFGWNGQRNWRYEENKGYTGDFDTNRSWHVEEEITIEIQAEDTSPYGPNSTTRSITFNSPRPFQLENLAPINNETNIDPELSQIELSVYDDWAGVDSGSLVITLREGSISGPIVKQYSGTDLTLTAYSNTFPSNGIEGSQGITHSYNYQTTLTGYGRLNELTTYYVIVSGLDMAYVPTVSNPSFSFTTRASCKSIQCNEGVTIYTGGIGTDIFYFNQALTVSGGTYPYVSGNNLYCTNAGYQGFDIYQNGTRIDYGVSTGGTLFGTFSGEQLTVQVEGGTAVIVGNTIYVTKTETPSGGGGGGGGTIYRDNCRYPYSRLPGANAEGVDYSDSYFDGICYLEQDHFAAFDNCDAEKEEIMCSYEYCYGIKSTTMPTFDDADMYGDLIRKHAAKIMSEYAINILEREPDLTKECIYEDMAEESEEMQHYATLACQLGIMGLEYDGTKAEEFYPNSKMTRAMFGTVLSRILFGDAFNGDKEVWYRPHLQALNRYDIMTQIDKPDKVELRGWVMIMLRRTARLLQRDQYYN